MDINDQYNKYKNNRKLITFKYLKKEKATKKYRICIIVPHRNRIDHLKKLLDIFKSESNIDIFIIDQNNADKFNRGLLLNIGYLIAKKHYSYDRFIFHDVDSYPDEDLIDFYNQYINYNIHYACNDYKYNFSTFMGGVIGFTKKDYEKINGFPNSFFGWGGEDDAMYNRCAINNINIYRPEVGKYQLDEHEGPSTYELNKIKKKKILYDVNNWYKDGIKQVLNYYINYKKYTKLSDFIKSLDITVNDTNFIHSDLLQKIDRDHDNLRTESNLISPTEEVIANLDPQAGAGFVQNIYFYKVDYISTHHKMMDFIENKDIVQQKVKAKIQYFIDNKYKYFQHKTNPIFISFMEPIIEWNEIKEKILDTFTKPKKCKKILKNDKMEKLVKDNFGSYQKGLTKKNLEDTLKLVFDNYTELLYFRIRNNKLECAYHIYNPDIKIDWYKYLKYKNNNLDNSLLELMEQRGIRYHTLMKPHFLHANNCLLNFEAYTHFEGNPYTYVKEFQDMILATLNKYELPDCDLLINRKDFPYLRKDNKSAYEHLNTDIITDIKKYWMVGSQSNKDINLDIPVPSADEWKATFKELNSLKWKDKKDVALFRGSSTGCSSTLDNPRIKLADISYKWSKDPNKKNLIDAALSKLVIRIKAYNKIIGVDRLKELEYLKGSFIDEEEQKKYKYIFNIQGNAQAYRYPSEFKKQSVVLNVKSEFKMWFEPLLENKKNFIEIDSNYDNLYETLSWLKKNDKEAEQIAKNGYTFYKENLDQSSIIDYWYMYMYYTNLYSC